MVTQTPVTKVPPPPSIADNPALNRWLLTLQQVINNSGFVSGSAVDLSSNSSFQTLQSAEATDAENITTINGEITTINGEITTINGEITTINGEITTINGKITALSTILNGSGAPAAGSGADGDLYVDNVKLAAGTTPKLYGRTGGTWYSIA